MISTYSYFNSFQAIVGNVLVSRTVCGVTGSSDVKDRDGNPPLEVEIIKVEAGLKEPGLT